MTHPTSQDTHLLVPPTAALSQIISPQPAQNLINPFDPTLLEIINFLTFFLFLLFQNVANID